MDHKNTTSPLKGFNAVTPAQVYATAVRTGEPTHDRALYYTIERKQPERKEKVNPHMVPSYIGHPESSEHGQSFAQRLYASALSHKSSGLPSSDIPVLPPIVYASSVHGSQVWSGVLPASLPTSSFETSSEVSQSLNPVVPYHNNVTMLPSRDSTPEVRATHPPPLPSALQIPNLLPVTQSQPATPRATCSWSQNTTLPPEDRKSRHAFGQISTASMKARSYSTPPLSGHGASDLRGTPDNPRLPPVPPPRQQAVIALSSSLPAFEEYDGPFNPSENVVDVAPALTHKDGWPDSVLRPSLEASREDIPSYSLVDEQLPPPAFDDIHTKDVIVVPPEKSSVILPESLLKENLASSSRSFSHYSTSYDPGSAPAYKISYSVDTSKSMEHAETPLPAIIAKCVSSGSLNNFQSRNPTLSVSSPTSPLSSNFHSLSALSHSPDCQSTRTSYTPPVRRRSPPSVNYHTKPRWPSLPPALQRWPQPS